MLAQPHLQSYLIASAFQFGSLILDALDFCKLGPVLNDIGQQGAVTNTPNSIAHEFRRGELWLQHTHGLIGESIDGSVPVYSVACNSPR